MIEMIMKSYWEEVCRKKAVAKLNTIPVGELQYSAPIYFYEFTFLLNPQRPTRPDPRRSTVVGLGTGRGSGAESGKRPGTGPGRRAG